MACAATSRSNANRYMMFGKSAKALITVKSCLISSWVRRSISSITTRILFPVFNRRSLILTAPTVILTGGLNPNAASFVGLTAVYPECRARNARVNTLADRVNECFERSLNGQALPPDSSKLQAVVAISPGSRAEFRRERHYPGEASSALSHGDLTMPPMGSKCLRTNVPSVTASTARGRWRRRRSGARNPTTDPPLISQTPP